MNLRAILLTTLALGALAAAPAAVEAQTGSVSGVVTSDAGDPLMGVWVRASDGGSTWGFGQSDFTGMDGAYAIDNLAPGSYEVSARRFGFETMTATVDVVDGVNTVQDFVLSAPTFGTVAGVVTDSATGLPIEDAFVRVTGTSAGGFFGGFFGNFAITDAAGAYSVDDVRTGDRDVSFHKLGYFSQTVVVTVADGVTTTADAALDPLTFGTVTGIVVDGLGVPVDGAFVFTRGGGGGGFLGGWSVTTTDATGAFSLEDVVTGERDIRIFASGFFSETVTATVVEAGTDLGTIVLGALTYGSVSGTVSDSVTGLAIDGAWVRVSHGGWTQTDRMGMYTVTDVLTGTRNVRVFAQNYVHQLTTVDVTDGAATTADFALVPR